MRPPLRLLLKLVIKHDGFFSDFLMNYNDCVPFSLCDEVFRESDKCRKYRMQPPSPLQGI